MDSKEHKKETIQNSITKSEFKKYVDFIHDDSIPLPEHERTYLKNLLKMVKLKNSRINIDAISKT